MTGTATRHRIRWDQPEPGQVLADADTDARTITLTLPDNQSLTLDVVTARAVSMLLSHVVFGVLQPDGPFLAVQAESGHGWLDLREER